MTENAAVTQGPGDMADRSSNPPRSEEQRFAERETIGRWLYIGAWAVEIIAVLIGLAIAIMTVAAGNEEMQRLKGDERSFGDYTNLLIAAFPFVMVAVVELTKIPFAGAFYKTRSIIWKLIFFLVLAFLALITFESALNGFERNFSALTYSIDSHRKDLAFVNERIAINEERITEARALTAETIEENFNSRREQLRLDRQAQTSAIQSQIDQIRASIQSDYIKGLREERDLLSADLKNLQEERREELERLKSSHDARDKDLSKDIEIRRNQYSAEYKRKESFYRRALDAQKKALENAGFFNRGRIEDEQRKLVDQAKRESDQARDKLYAINASAERDEAYAKQREALSSVENRYNTQLADLRQRINQKSLEISRATATREADIDEILTARRDEIKAVEIKFDKQMAENSDERARKFGILKNNDVLIAGLEEELTGYRSERAELRDNINRRVGDNQVYRIAQQAFGTESAADLGRDQVAVIAMIWFGSLAALVALTGIMLALASYVIRDPDRTRHDVAIGKRTASLVDSARRAFVFYRKRQREPKIRYLDRQVPKEVVKEIPVEKVVKVETPVQIVRNRIVHVPLYTNDPELLKISNSQRLEELEEELNQVELSSDDDSN